MDLTPTVTATAASDEDDVLTVEVVLDPVVHNEHLVYGVQLSVTGGTPATGRLLISDDADTPLLDVHLGAKKLYTLEFSGKGASPGPGKGLKATYTAAGAGLTGKLNLLGVRG